MAGQAAWKTKKTLSLSLFNLISILPPLYKWDRVIKFLLHPLVDSPILTLPASI
jgi:hypothetical protein